MLLDTMTSDSGVLRTRMVIFSYLKPTEPHRMNIRQNQQRKSTATTAASIISNNFFEDGMLLESKEKGVIYPIIHCARFYGWPNGLLEESSQLKVGSHGDDYVIEQGVYAELESVHADLFGSSYDDIFTSRTSGVTPTWSTFYLVLGFKQIEKTPFRDMMESHWKEWSGARYLFLNLPDEFGLVKLTLYKKCPTSDINSRSTADTDMDLFLYLLIAECVHVTARHRIFIKDFVQRMRADQMPPYVALYEETVGDADKSGLSETTSLRRRRSLSGGSRSSSPFSNGTATSPLFGSPVSSFRSTFTFTVV